ncbi:ATP-dependent RNA helicase-like protein dbp8 [Saccharata proteae CBS 121410]|uniref:ATP-dependent RNA helicase-like protein dbp8 n=1 Tax=Saccharata proteae CBS 121410 TaxID=1314787 RepID=A0A9P4HZK2_9PEZI|nr:ATP-dependent RNA helicase-like protein dbp8 [Saccharata proteae CBS 121410]
MSAYESSSGSESETSQVNLEQSGASKRRKLSIDSDLSDSVPSKPVSSFPTSTLSRVGAKRAEEVPASIVSAQNHKENLSFASLNVSPWLVASLASMAIKKPTGIQKGCIPEILKGRDCIGGSRTGSGKTAAFAVPILQKWAEDPVGIFAVILTPTRELALQIYEQLNAIGGPQSLKTVLVTGGADMRAQAIALSSRPHIVVATPGRLADHVNTSGEDTVGGLRRTRFVVLDEADRLLEGGHGSMLPDVETCLSVLPPSSERQTLLFTATVTPEVRALREMPRAKNKPEVFVCEVDTEDLAVPTTLQQKYMQVPVTHREAFLHTFLQTPANESKSIIIFVNRTTTAQLLEQMLRLLDHKVTSLHSGLPQSKRISNLSRFRAKASRILVATDVAARGLDIPAVEMVINYDVPRDPDDYIHRVGRTARAGRSGESVTWVGQRDVQLVLAIEERVGMKMVEYEEEGVNIETRVIRDALKVVGEKKREALLEIEEGRDAVTGKRKKGMVKRRK